MQIYDDAVVTDPGLQLLNRAQAGEAQIQFTRIVVGDGTYTEGEKDPQVLGRSTSLKSARDSYALSSVEVASATSVKVTALITNQDPVTAEAIVTEGYCINEMGLYAKERDGDSSTEVLYSITTAKDGLGDYMPPYNGHSPAQITHEYYVTVSNAAEVTINLAGAGAAMLAEVAEARFQGLAETIQGLIEAERGLAETIQGLTETLQGLQEKQERDRADIDYIALMRGVDL